MLKICFVTSLEMTFKDSQHHRKRYTDKLSQCEHSISKGSRWHISFESKTEDVWNSPTSPFMKVNGSTLLFNVQFTNNIGIFTTLDVLKVTREQFVFSLAFLRSNKAQLQVTFSYLKKFMYDKVELHQPSPINTLAILS